MRPQHTTRLVLWSLASTILALAACSPPPVDGGAAPDASQSDGGTPWWARGDAGTRSDGGSIGRDGGSTGSGSTDAGSPDAGQMQGGCDFTVSVVDYFSGQAIPNVTATLDGRPVNAGNGMVCTSSLGQGVHPLAITASGYPTWNGAIQVPGGARSRTVPLFPESPAMSAWLVKVNADRKANGAGPVQLDDMLSIVAFDHAADMATQNYFAHFDPKGFSPGTRSLLLGSMMMGAENLAAGNNTWSGAESSFMAEKSMLPNRSPQDCAQNDAAAGHYCDIVWPTHNWVGLAIVEKSGTDFGTYYDQEFGDLYGYYDTTVVPSEPSLGSSASVAFLGANGATIQDVQQETMPTPTPISISTLNNDPTCASSCPAADPWYPSNNTTQFNRPNPLPFNFSQKQIYFGGLYTNVQPFAGYGAWIAAFAGGAGPTQSKNASLNVQSQ